MKESSERDIFTDARRVTDARRNAAYLTKTRKAGIMRARRIVAAFAGYEDEAIRNGDLDPQTLEVARMEWR